MPDTPLHSDHNHLFHVPLLYKRHKGLMTKKRLRCSGNPTEHSGVWPLQGRFFTPTFPFYRHMMPAASITKGICDKRIFRRDLIPVERTKCNKPSSLRDEIFFSTECHLLPICRPWPGRHYPGCQSFYRYHVPAATVTDISSLPGRYYYRYQSFYRYHVPAGTTWLRYNEYLRVQLRM